MTKEIPKQAVEAAALAIFNVEREYHGLDPIAWDFPALSSWHRERGLRQARAALEAALPLLMGAQCREDVARIIDPELFERYDLEVASGRRAENGKLWADVCYGVRIAQAIAKVEAVLALPHTGQPQEVALDKRDAAVLQGWRTADAGKIATALGLFASCVKAGEEWSERCEKAKNEAFDALARLSAAPASPRAEGEWLPRVIAHLENGEDHNDGAFDESCDTCLLLRDLRALVAEQRQPEPKP